MEIKTGCMFPKTSEVCNIELTNVCYILTAKAKVICWCIVENIDIASEDMSRLELKLAAETRDYSFYAANAKQLFLKVQFQPKLSKDVKQLLKAASKWESEGCPKGMELKISPS